MATIRVVYEHGVLRPLEPLNLDDGSEFDVQILELPSKPKKRVLGRFKGMLQVPDDFDEPLELVVSPKEQAPQSERIMDLHPNVFEMSADFDEPLPDSFWLGEDNQ